MYRKYFGLREKPFSLLPDPNYLYLSEQHKAAATMLEYGLHEMTGITVISGAVGSGKTTLIRYLLQRINYSYLAVGLINTASRSYDDLMKWVALAFNLPFENKGRVELHRDVQNFIVSEYSQGRRSVLIVDEAQNLDRSSLEELRLVSNINSDKDQLLQIILVGQPELMDVLRQPEMFQLAQRVSSEFHLTPLTMDETKEYIVTRLTRAGGRETLFEILAIAGLYYLTGGVPRLINTMCDYALVHAYALGKKSVDINIVLELINGKTIGGINRAPIKTAEREVARIEVKRITGVDLAQFI